MKRTLSKHGTFFPFFNTNEQQILEQSQQGSRGFCGAIISTEHFAHLVEVVYFNLTFDTCYTSVVDFLRRTTTSNFTNKHQQK